MVSARRDNLCCVDIVVLKTPECMLLDLARFCVHFHYQNRADEI